MSEQTLALIAAIRKRLDRTVRRIALAHLFSGLALTVGSLALIWFVVSAAEARFWFGVPVRTMLAILIAVAFVVLAGSYVLLPYLRLRGIYRPYGTHEVAARVGAHFPEVSDRLLNLIELADGQRTDAPAPLVDRATRMLGEQIRDVPFEQVEDFHEARRRLRWAAVPAILLLVFAIAAPGSFLHASERLLSPATEFQRPGPFAFILSPEAATFVKGQAVDIVVRANGRQIPSRIHLSVNVLGEKQTEQFELVRDSTGAYRYRIPEVRASFRFRAEAGSVVSVWHRATVVSRPLVRSLQATLTYPSYTGMASSRLEANNGDISAIVGTSVHLDVSTGGSDVAQAFLRFDDGTRQNLEVRNGKATGAFRVRSVGGYSIVLRSEDGIENDNRIHYTIAAVPDGAPTIVQLDPGPEAELNQSKRVDLRARINDDFGFSAMRLYYRATSADGQSKDSTFTSIPVSIPSNRELDQEIARKWLLEQDSNLKPSTGDVVEYFLQVWDNDGVSGPKAARTPVYRLRIPSLQQHYEELGSEQDAAASTLEELTKEARNLQNDFKELQNELRKDPEASWEDKRQLQQLQEKQQALEQRVDDLSQKMEDITERMKENGLVSEKTIAAYKELQRIVEEMRSPELAEALRELQKALDSMNLQQMQESMKQYQFSEQQYQQRLERTVELFKKLRLQQGLDEAAKRAADLVQKEKELQEKTETLQQSQNRQQQSKDQQLQSQNQRKEGAEQLAKEQDQARQEMEALQKRLEELTRDAQDMKRGPNKEMNQLNEQVRKEQLDEQMKRNSEQLRQQQLKEAQKGQQQIQQKAAQMQQSLEQIEQQMQQSGQQANMEGVRRALQNVLTLSKDQEQLRNDVRRLTSDAPQLRPYARRQVDLTEGFGRVSDSLRALSRQIPQMTRDIQEQSAETLREMNGATESMAEGIVGEAAGRQKEAMMHLNELALLLSNLMNQMQNSSGGGGMSMEQMLQQMQQMTGEQQKLNDQIQKMLNDIQGNRLTVDMQQRMRQMSEAQEAIRKQLKQISRDPNAQSQTSGDLNKIANDMEQTEQELQQSRTNRQMIERQQQILTRMLEAQRSMQEREQEERRESRSGRDATRTTPGGQMPAQDPEKLRRDLLRALEGGYAPDYEDLIKRYFELLQQQQAPPKP